MKAAAILDRLLDKADWVDKEKTVDRIIIGDPGRDVTRALVTWMSTFDAVRQAVAGRYDLLITHEPTFWEHRDREESWKSSPTGLAKKRFIEDAGLVILRCHCVWDRFPEIGIPWAWAKFLGIDGKPHTISAGGYQHRYDIAPATLDVFAKGIARKTATLGEPAIQVVGDGSMTVSKIGIGTGCGCNVRTFMAMGCDVSIVCDDGTCAWRDHQYARDARHAVLRVNHGTSEEPGMRTLTKYINDNFAGVTADHLPHGNCFRLVGQCP